MNCIDEIYLALCMADIISESEECKSAINEYANWSTANGMTNEGDSIIMKMCYHDKQDGFRQGFALGARLATEIFAKNHMS